MIMKKIAFLHCNRIGKILDSCSGGYQFCKTTFTCVYVSMCVYMYVYLHTNVEGGMGRRTREVLVSHHEILLKPADLNLMVINYCALRVQSL